MTVEQQLKDKGLYTEFCNLFCIESSLGPYVLTNRMEEAKVWLEENGVVISANPAFNNSKRTLIKEHDFRVDQWAVVVNKKLDHLDKTYDKAIEAGNVIPNSFFNYDMSVLYTIDKKRLDAYPVTIARVRAFADKIGAKPYCTIDGDIDTEIAYDQAYYDAFVKEPFKAIRGNPEYFEELCVAQDTTDCIGRP